MSESNEADLVQMVVDEDTCIGGGVCEMLEAETFLLDDDTVIATVIGTGRLPLARAEILVDRCPGRAISFTAIEPQGEDVGESK